MVKVFKWIATVATGIVFICLMFGEGGSMVYVFGILLVLLVLLYFFKDDDENE